MTTRMGKFLHGFYPGSFVVLGLCGALIGTALGQSAGDKFNQEAGEHLPGGETTHFKKLNRNAFSHASQNLNFEQELNFKVGNGFFRRIWISSPASTQAADGLGPIFNSRSCQRCHIKDGRGHPPLNHDELSESLLLTLSIPPQTDKQRLDIESGRINSVGDPIYGNQLQNFSVQGVPAEGKISIDLERYELGNDRNKVTLEKPSYQITDLAYGPLHDQIRFSPRVAPQMIGLGLLEVIDEEEILKWSDPKDADKDGISGNPNIVWSKEYGKLMLGRFGHKAAAPTINQQNQNAFFNDIGLSVPLNRAPWGDCTENQVKCRGALHGDSVQYEGLEVHSVITDMVLFYTRNLAVPARRNLSSPDVWEGKELFNQSGCDGCHRAFFTTPTIEGRPEHSNQIIWPYTDLLLHDMGKDLADHAPQGRASGREWRTAPLWGIGLTEIVSGHTRFLHDGRARNLLEAIYWHGGEAEAARNKVINMTQKEREQLIEFIESL